MAQSSTAVLGWSRLREIAQLYRLARGTTLAAQGQAAGVTWPTRRAGACTLATVHALALVWGLTPSEVASPYWREIACRRFLDSRAGTPRLEHS